MFAGQKPWYLLVLLILLLLSACGTKPGNKGVATKPVLSNGIGQGVKTGQQIVIPSHRVTITPTATPKPQPTTVTLPPTTAPIPTQAPQSPPTNIPGGGTGPAPYGQPPAMTAEEIQITQKLFALINSDRAARGLYPFIWNATLAGGARLHSWNMTHCGFSHTCPDGENQCTRIANEGFAGYTDCGENIALAGPYPTPWGGVYNIQESMMNEGPTGWHFIHLTSTTLHRMGVGVFVDARGWLWFTEDMVS